MSNETVFQVCPLDIEEILEKAAREPGINDVLALMRLSQELFQVEEIGRELTVPPFTAQVSGTAGWVR